MRDREETVIIDYKKKKGTKCIKSINENCNKTNK